MILLLTNEEDVTTDFVVRELRIRGADHLRLNTETLGRGPSLSITAAGSVRLRVGGGLPEISLDRCSAIYFRRPRVPDCSQTADPGVREFASREYKALLENLAAVLPGTWVNEPGAARRAEAKALQLRAASLLGFSVPRTLITNDAHAAREFAQTCSRGCLAKVLFGGRALIGGREHHAYAELVNPAEIAPESLALAPAVLQQRVDKVADLRLTVVQDDVFAAEITSGADGASPDWRKQAAVAYRPWRVPDSLRDRSVALIASLGLRFGAIDLALDEAGVPWFLEVNPNGQWAWIEVETGLPIAARIADCLCDTA